MNGKKLVLGLVLLCLGFVCAFISVVAGMRTASTWYLIPTALALVVMYKGVYVVDAPHKQSPKAH